MSESIVVFKCSFGGSDGWGHVIRSSAVAKAFQDNGWETVLWTTSDSTCLLDEARKSFDSVVENIWSLELVQNASVLFVDEMYTPDEDYARLAARWRSLSGRRILVGIDDMQQRTMNAFDLVINTEIGLESAGYASEKCLLGESYAMLRSGFSAPKVLKHKFPNTEEIPVFVMLGGTDPYHYTTRVLEELCEWNGLASPVVAYGLKGSQRIEVLNTLKRFQNYRLLENANSGEIAAWMKACKFGIIACGSSLYEAAAMKMPFIGLSLVDNQSATAEKVESHWRMPIVRREGKHGDRFDLGSELSRVLMVERDGFSEVGVSGCRRIVSAIEAIR